MSTSPPIASVDLPALLGCLGYAPATHGGLRLRGCYHADGSLRWAWSVTLRQPLFLEFYPATSLEARLFSALVQLIFACRLQGVFFQLLPGHYAATEAQAWPGAAFALAIGMPGPNRKAVVCYEAAPGQRAFAKLPLGPATSAGSEAEHLRWLAAQGFRTFSLPQVLAHEPGRLLQGSVKTPSARRTATFGLAHARCLAELLTATQVRQPLAASAYWQAVGQQVAALQDLGDTRVPFGLRTKLHYLRQAINPGQTLAFAFAHGDFTPCNCWVAPQGLALYDLELAQPEAPLLYDLFHFITQQALLVTRLPAAAIRAQALDVAEQYFGTVPMAELVLAWQLYVLHQAASGALRYHAQPHWPCQVSWLLNGWNALLTHELAATVAHRQLAVFDLLDYVQLLPQPGVVLQPRVANAYYPAPAASLDLLLTRPDTAAGVRFLQHFPLVQSVAVRRASHQVSVDCLLQDNSLLTVDLLHQLHCQELCLLDAGAVLTQAERGVAGVRVPALRHDFAYTWLLCWLNERDLPLTDRHYFQQGTAAEQADLLACLHSAYGTCLPSVAAASVYQADKAVLLRHTLHQQPANRRPLRRWRAPGYLRRTLAGLGRPGKLVDDPGGVAGAGRFAGSEPAKESQLTQQYQALVGKLSFRYHYSRYLPIKNHNSFSTLAVIGRHFQNEL